MSSFECGGREKKKEDLPFSCGTVQGGKGSFRKGKGSLRTGTAGTWVLRSLCYRTRGEEESGFFTSIVSHIGKRRARRGRIRGEERCTENPSGTVRHEVKPFWHLAKLRLPQLGAEPKNKGTKKDDLGVGRVNHHFTMYDFQREERRGGELAGEATKRIESYYI